MARKRLSPANPMFLKSDSKKENTSKAPISAVAAGAAVSSALEEVTQELVTARNEGRLIQNIKIDKIELNWLARDRIAMDEEELSSLKASIVASGQRTPIEVVDKASTSPASQSWGLISGMRRVLALQALYKETGDAQYAVAKAIIRPVTKAADTYVAMVEENEIRSDISFYERAQLVAQSVERGVFATEKDALGTLFKNVSRAKRSKIKSFIELYHGLGQGLKFPTQISEKLGLSFISFLRDNESSRKEIILKLQTSKTAEEEMQVLQSCLQGPTAQGAKKNVSRAKQISAVHKKINDNLELIFDGKTIQVKGTGVNKSLFNKLILDLK